jgi:hypothetical protein
MNKIGITIIKKAVNVVAECPDCSECIEWTYDDLENILGESCGWGGENIECPHCESVLEIDYIIGKKNLLPPEVLREARKDMPE